jgi:hypothetical protein
MPLPQIRGGTGHQTPRRARRAREVNTKNLPKRHNRTNQRLSSIQNMRTALLKVHLISFLGKLRNREKVVTKVTNQSNIPHDKTLRN